MTEKEKFYFLGTAPPSKSLLNRALIVRGWFPDFDIQGASSCDDIQIMTDALKSLSSGEVNCGLSATAFRFLALFLSRKGGEYFLTGQPRLLNRPMQELPMILSQLGASAVREEKGWKISSKGWKPQGDYVNIPYKTTSQYASGLLLSAWNLKRDLFFALNRKQVSFAHFQMTVDFVRQLGMEVKGEGAEYCVPAGQTLKVFHCKTEQDQNCLFVLAALAALKGKAVFSHWTENSLQPEAAFPDILEKMGVPINRGENRLTVFKTDFFKPVKIDLCSTPDLFPVLSVLCARANGTSQLSGLRHLAYKESHRLNQMAELFKLANIPAEKTEDTFTIYGKKWGLPVKPFEFNGGGDHRIIMAAALLQKTGVPVHITGKEAVNKSFPDFFKYSL